MAITSGALLGAAGIGAAGSLLGGLLGTSSQKSANSTNLQIARETNQMNRELFNQQLAWQEDMWNKTNAYNDPSHQVELLQRAGINPAAVYGNGSTSPASMPSVPSAPQMQGATVNPVDYSYLGNVVDNGVNAYLNNQILNNTIDKTAADAQIAKVQAEFDAKSLQDRLIRTANDASKSEFERETARMELKFLTTTFDQRVMQSEQLTKINKLQMDETFNRIQESKLRQTAQQIANEFAPQANAAQLKQYQASISQMYAAARASDASAANQYAQEALNNLSAEGVKIDNRTRERCQNALVDEAFSKADQAYQLSENARLQNDKLKAQGRYGELGYRVLGSAIPQAEEKVKSVLKKAAKGASFIGKHYKRGVEQGKRKVRH